MVLTLQSLQHASLADATSSLALATAGVAAAVAALLWLSRSPSKPPPARDGAAPVKPPRRLPTTQPWLADTLDLLGHMPDLHEWMTQWCLHFRGEPYLMRMVGLPDINVVYTPQHFEDVFKHQFENFPKGRFFNDNLRDLLGHGIFAVDGRQWLNQRKIASHMFTMRAMRESMAVAVAAHLVPLCRVLAKAATTGDTEPIDLYRLFNRFTMEAFAQIAFGVEMKSLEQCEEHPLQKALDRVQEVIVLRFMRPIWFWKLQRWLNVGAEADMRASVATLDQTVLEIVTKALARRADKQAAVAAGRQTAAPIEVHDIVSLFLDHVDTIAAEERGDVEFNAAFFRDIVMNFMFAGRDATAQTLSWLFVKLDAHPHVTAKIREEIASVLPSLARGTVASPSIDDVAQLTYLEAAIRETLRLHPPIPINTKYVAQDVVLSDGTLLREGSTVSIAAWAMGRMPFVWGDDAAQFKPERWLDDGKLLSVSPYKFISFNAGPRMCLGINLAMTEIKMVLATVLSRFRVELEPNQHITYVNSVTLPIKGEMLVRIYDDPLK